MDDPQTHDLLRQMRSRDSDRAWPRFLELYSPLLLEVVRLFERDEDAVEDCYLFICEHLSRDNFRRLRHFRLDGPARFSTWLWAVARNLCLDWHRREVGRERVFESVARMPALEQEIFRCLFVDFLPAEEVLPRLRPVFPGLTAAQANESVQRLERALTPRQRWLLTVHLNRGLAAATGPLGLDDEGLKHIPSEQPDPETRAGLQEERRALVRAMSELSTTERLLIRLRFERDAPKEVAMSLKVRKNVGVRVALVCVLASGGSVLSAGTVLPPTTGGQVSRFCKTHDLAPSSWCPRSKLPPCET